MDPRGLRLPLIADIRGANASILFGGSIWWHKKFDLQTPHNLGSVGIA